METISIFFILMSIVVLGYLIYTFKTLSRTHILIELFYLVAYSFVLAIFVYPNLLKVIERIFGINSAINFFVYLSIFLSYAIVYYLYQKSERQRQEITKLVREIAYLKKKEKKQK
jgi:hypothetical protein